ncbi:MAG: hypothetical protein SFT91_00555 [Rickettsiaceae bacterium]|nr:hypothetical protein [Rickettsiaceae bacterium]
MNEVYKEQSEGLSGAIERPRISEEEATELSRQLFDAVFLITSGAVDSARDLINRGANINTVHANLKPHYRWLAPEIILI